MVIVYLDCISRFIYGSEDLYMRVRREIYDAAQLRMNSYPDITIDTEKGPLHIRLYSKNYRRWFLWWRVRN